MKIIGHRGCAGLEPENTLRAFQRAIELETDEVELDIRETLDGYLVVIHNEKVNRTTNGKGLVRNLALRQLQEFDAGKGEKVPRLEEALNLLRNSGLIVNIEIKQSGYEEAVANLIKNYDMHNAIIVISFQPEIIKKIKALDSKITTGLILKRRHIKPRTIAEQLNVVRVCLKYTIAAKKLISAFQNLGIEVVVWTVDKPKDIQRMIKLKVDGICSNYPDRVKEILSR